MALNKVNYVDNQTIITAENLNAIQDSIITMEALNSNNAGFHNSIYRGKDITSLGIDTICSRISSGTFEDLYIGDYFDITISSDYTASETVRCVLAGFDTYYMNGDTSFTSHHAVIVPKNCFTATAAMNSTDTTEGGFIGSDMWKTVLPTYATAIKNSAIGSHLLTHRTLLTNSMSSTISSMGGAGWSGAANSWEWIDTELSLMNEVQLYGCTALSSSFYDVGCDNLQLPLFRLNPRSKIAGQGGTGDGRMWYWLRSVASTLGFCRCGYDGDAHHDYASISRGVRPLFCIG